MGFLGCTELWAGSRCVEIKAKQQCVQGEMQVVGGLTSRTQCLKARRVNGSAGRTVTACCGELEGKAAKVVKKKRLSVFGGYCAPNGASPAVRGRMQAH